MGKLEGERSKSFHFTRVGRLEESMRKQERAVQVPTHQGGQSCHCVLVGGVPGLWPEWRLP